MDVRRATDADLPAVIDDRVAFVAEVRGIDPDAVDAAFVERYLGDLSRSADLSRYVL